MKIKITAEEDVVVARLTARKASTAAGFSLLDQTRITTAVSELARNIILYAGQGSMECSEILSHQYGKGLHFVFSDSGPGIADIPLALTPGYSTGGGLGLGLSGTRRLMDEFTIVSTPGTGTTITITKWLGRSIC